MHEIVSSNCPNYIIVYRYKNDISNKLKKKTVMLPKKVKFRIKEKYSITNNGYNKIIK